MNWKYYNIPDAGSSANYQHKFWVPFIGNDLYRLDNGDLILPLHRQYNDAPVMFSPEGDTILGDSLEDSLLQYYWGVQILKSTDNGKTWSVADTYAGVYYRHPFIDTYFAGDNGGLTSMCNAEKIHCGLVTLSDDAHSYGGEPCGGDLVLKYCQYNPETEAWLAGEVALRPHSENQGWFQCTTDGRRWGRYSGSWSGNYESATITTSDVGASITITVKDADYFRITAYKSPDYGTFTVSKNGGAPTTVNLYKTGLPVLTLVYNDNAAEAEATYVITCASGLINIAALVTYLDGETGGKALGYKNDTIYSATIKAFTRGDGSTRLLVCSLLYLYRGWDDVEERYNTDSVVLFHEVDVSPEGVMTLIEEKELSYYDDNIDTINILACGMSYFAEDTSATPAYEDPDIYVILQEDLWYAGWESGPTNEGAYITLHKRVEGNWSSKELYFGDNEISEFSIVYNTINVVHKENKFLVVSMLVDSDVNETGHCISLAYDLEDDIIYEIEDVWVDPSDGSDIWSPCLTVTSSGTVHILYSDYSSPIEVMRHKTISLGTLSAIETNTWTSKDDVIIPFEHVVDPEDNWFDPYTCTDIIQGKIRAIGGGPKLSGIDSSWSMFYVESGVGTAEIGPNTQGGLKTNNKYGTS
jgi:hypothetical protein